MNIFWLTLGLLTRRQAAVPEVVVSKGAPRPDDWMNERRSDANETIIRRDDETVMAAVRKFLEVVQ